MHKINTLKKTGLLLCFISIFTLINSQESPLGLVTGEWKFAVGSELTFEIGNLFLFSVEGAMPVKEGIYRNKEELKVDVTINAAKLNTGNKKRDEHLNTEDFFYTEKYPNIYYESDRIRKNRLKNEYEYVSIGKLTIRGIKKEEKVFFNIEKINNNAVIINGKAEINRFDYDLDHKMAGMDDIATISFDIAATPAE